MQLPQAGETASELWLERSQFAGIVLGGVFYGLHFAVFIMSMYYVIKAPATGKISWPFLSLLIGFFISGTVQVAAEARFGELVWIDNRGSQGGPIGWYHAHYDDPSNILSLAAFIFGTFLADAVLLYRMFVIWNRNYFVMVIPFLAYLASTALSIVAVFQAAQPYSSRWSHSTVIFEMPYWALTTSLNIVITIALSFRLLKMRKAVKETLGAGHAKLYTSIVTMIVESAAIYAVFGLACIITFATGSQLLNIVEPMLGQVLCICPDLIILRVARGSGWKDSPSQNNSTDRVLIARPMSEARFKRTIRVPTVTSTSEGSLESYADV